MSRFEAKRSRSTGYRGYDNTYIYYRDETPILCKLTYPGSAEGSAAETSRASVRGSVAYIRSRRPALGGITEPSPTSSRQGSQCAPATPFSVSKREHRTAPNLV